MLRTCTFQVFGLALNFSLSFTGITGVLLSALVSFTSFKNTISSVLSHGTAKLLNTYSALDFLFLTSGWPLHVMVSHHSVVRLLIKYWETFPEWLITTSLLMTLTLIHLAWFSLLNPKPIFPIGHFQLDASQTLKQICLKSNFVLISEQLLLPWLFILGNSITIYPVAKAIILVIIYLASCSIKNFINNPFSLYFCCSNHYFPSGYSPKIKLSVKSS